MDWSSHQHFLIGILYTKNIIEMTLFCFHASMHAYMFTHQVVVKKLYLAPSIEVNFKMFHSVGLIALIKTTHFKAACVQMCSFRLCGQIKTSPSTLIFRPWVRSRSVKCSSSLDTMNSPQSSDLFDCRVTGAVTSVSSLFYYFIWKKITATNQTQAVPPHPDAHRSVKHYLRSLVCGQNRTPPVCGSGATPTLIVTNLANYSFFFNSPYLLDRGRAVGS